LSEIFSSFIEQYYDKTTNIPPHILIPEEPTFKKELEEWLSSKKSRKVKIEIPKIGRKNHLINLANKNAQNYARQMRIQWMTEEKKDPNNVIPNLKQILKLPKDPLRIECFDISHLAGTHTVGSMVVFINGEPEKNHYRQFNIKSLKNLEINDFASMYEVLIRRLKYIKTLNKDCKVKIKDNKITIFNKDPLADIEYQQIDNQILFNAINIHKKHNHLIDLIFESLKKLKSSKYLVSKNLANYKDLFISAGFIEINHPDYILGYYPQKQTKDLSFSTKPDLIVIDGGKGQLKYALKARDELGLKIPIISLAKRHEEIFLEDKTKVLLQYGSGELSLIQRLRDEAHRFAITKNREKRNKKMTE
jgi:excinuclease ABC subunit C